MQKSNINPEILQQMLDSATNAAEKGQSQFFTPPAFATQLAVALPKHRPTLMDLNCGNGQLLQASVNTDTRFLYGCDIDPCKTGVAAAFKDSEQEGVRLPVKRINYDLTLLYPILKEVGVVADCLVLNPPWRLHWHRERLTDLAASDLPAVRDAFAATEPSAPHGTIDSTIATLLIALDLCTAYGEGMLIANNATLERLLFAPDAPFSAAAKHVWAHVIFPGNPMTGIDTCLWEKDQQFNTGVIYFARDHTVGARRLLPAQLTEFCRQFRQGAELRSTYHADTTLAERWQAARDRVSELEGNRPRVPFNLWLTAGGRIRTALSLFQECSRKVNKKEAERLRGLIDKTPMELVLQRNTRDELLHVAERGGWRVEPALIQAIQSAVRDYHGARAPLYPLPPVQRLGYLDEQDMIECELDLPLPDGRVAFQSGRRYGIRTQTVQVTRSSQKPNAYTGELEELEFNGQELAIYITGEVPNPNIPADGKDKDPCHEFCFMDATLKNDRETRISDLKAKGIVAKPDALKIDFTLQQLCEHFIIPDVPDVATVNPEGYNANLQLLEELELLCPN